LGVFFLILALCLAGLKSDKNRGFAIAALIILPFMAAGYLAVYLFLLIGGLI
jgi:hypothetical protein